jgi:hypothetical protein
MLPYSNLNLSYLERLSTDELNELAVHFGIDIPPDLERVFIIEELLDNAPCLTFYQSGNADTSVIASAFNPPADTAAPATSVANGSAEDTNAEDTEADSAVQPYSAAELPESYNITYIDVIVRDPLWVFVFWEIRDADRRAYERQAGFRGYFLRVNLDSCKMGLAVSSLYTVPVDISDSEWYINFPPDSPCRRLCGGAEAAAFNVTLCAARTGGTDVLASSVPFSLPKTLPPPALRPATALVSTAPVSPALVSLGPPPPIPPRGARGITRSGDGASRSRVTGRHAVGARGVTRSGDGASRGRQTERHAVVARGVTRSGDWVSRGRVTERHAVGRRSVTRLADAPSTALLLLSGLDDLPVLRNGERPALASASET